MPQPDFDFDNLGSLDADTLDFLLAAAEGEVEDEALDLLAPGLASVQGVLSVEALNRRIGQVLEEEPLLSDIEVRGEITGWKHYGASGHCYFSLADSGATIAGRLWKRDAARLSFRPSNGDRVVASGGVDFYAKKGEVSFVVREMRFDGTGAMLEALERLKAKLASEGLFDPARKRPLPAMPRRIGLVTSSQGAVLRDIIQVLGRRWPLATLILIPAKVQGFDAVPDLLRALTWASAYEAMDVLIVARGGGSPEDLAAFNDEELARAVADFPVPVISAIGHETDVCLLDWVADVRAPTPSAAAEIVAPDARELLGILNGCKWRLHRGGATPLQSARQKLEWNKARPGLKHPRQRLGEGRDAVGRARARIRAAVESRVKIERQILTSHRAQMHALDPQRVLERGYALLEQLGGPGDGSLLTSVGQAQGGGTIRARLRDGSLLARILEVKVEEVTVEARGEGERREDDG